MSERPTDGATVEVAGALAASRRRRRRFLVPLGVAVTAAAIAAIVILVPRLTARPAAAVFSPSPIVVSGFVGTWAVAAPGESPETRLRVQLGELQVWLRSTGSGWELLGADGEVLARLTPGSRPTVPPTMAQGEADPPTLTGEQRRTLDAPVAPLPAGLLPLTGQLMIGTWAPKDGSPGFVTLMEDGRYVGNDGCNDASGTWAVDPAGHLLLAGKIFVTLEDCPGKSVDRELTGTNAVGFDGATLVVYHTSDSGSGGGIVDRLVHGTPMPWASG